MDDATGNHGVSGTLRCWPTILFWVLGTAVIMWIGHEAFTSRIVTQAPGADFWEHSAALRALIEDGPAPRAPMVDSDASSPRYMPHFVLIAFSGRLFDLDPLTAMALAATLNTALLVVGAWFFFLALFRDPRAPLYGLIVLLCSWYDGWNYSNVYQLRQLFSVASYPSTAAVGLSMIALALGIWATRPGPRVRPLLLVGMALLVAYILPTHPLTALMPLTGIFLLAVSAPGITWRRRGLVLAALLAGALLSLLWPYFSVLEVVLGTGDGGDTWIRSAALAGEIHPHYLHDFYDAGGILRTLGLATLGVFAITCFLFMRRHLFIALSAVILAVPFVANAFVNVPLGHRFILLSLFFLQVGLVWLLLRITPGFHERRRRGVPSRWWRPVLAWCVITVVLGSMVVHNFRRANARLQREVRKSTPAERTAVVETARRVADLAGPGAVILGERDVTWPLPTFGVRIVAHLNINPLVPDRQRRIDDVAAFFGGILTGKEGLDIIDRYRVTHVITPRDAPDSLLKLFDARAVRADPLPHDLVLHTLQ